MEKSRGNGLELGDTRRFFHRDFALGQLFDDQKPQLVSTKLRRMRVPQDGDAQRAGIW